MTDDFGSDSNIGFNGTFRSQNSVLKLNSVVNSGFKQKFNKGIRYDASFETKVFGLDSKFNFRAPHIEATFDLGAFKWAKVVAGQAMNFWFNPYIKFGFD
jgi:hypothetical protein